MINIRKLYIDFDGCVVNTIAAICQMYNEDFKYYKDFKPVKWWEVEIHILISRDSSNILPIWIGQRKY